MATTKVAITMETETLKELDRLVRKGVFPNRSASIQMILAEKLTTFSHKKFEMECEKLDPNEEKAFSREGFEADTQWPKY